MSKPKLLISFSGGETSGYMAKRLTEDFRDTHEIIALFANTGQENEESLVFVDICDREFGLNVVWIEADVQVESGKGTQANVVSFQTASRSGEPFEEVIKKYGLPNPTNFVCTRELKITPMQNYLRSIGWAKRSYQTAIGIRVDELDRMRSDAEKELIIYPLINWGVDKPEINRFWRDMHFRLELKSYEGNCKTCWKKSDRKLFTIAKENPERFEFFAEMEAKYSQYTPLSRAENAAPPYSFFRKHRTVEDILDQAAKSHFAPAIDDRERVWSIDQLSLLDDYDLSEGCTGECGV